VPVSPLLDLLDPDERRALVAATRRHRYAKGEVIFHEGDPGDALHVIEKGHVAIRVTTPLGDVVTLAVLGPGESFGEQAVVTASGHRGATAVAIGPVETRVLRAVQVHELRAAHPELDGVLIELLAAQVRRLTEHLLDALYVSAEVRVLRRLLRAAESFGDVHAGPVTLPITQDDLASMAGTTRPTVNRVLKAAEADGLVALSRGRIQVLDGATLTRKSH
jgi:CRP-like cAMP-binding protein